MIGPLRFDRAVEPASIAAERGEGAVMIVIEAFRANADDEAGALPVGSYGHPGDGGQMVIDRG
ncbi:hypothetical protein ACFFV7_40895 [Nonomuraea spiralis]|uniref:Uncharacterized protein n=1 Tax=Nonomuraea spiralis TaxID=46182 RepID=A0ABV5ISW5_9ACTN|nr:hypothetical protein [Nonomuraea spiralis]GGT45814.1 hypothetical protein GCM10010176_106190 [Nonomuraea spiralis]